MVFYKRMASFLYTWNPKNWEWDDIDYAIDCVVQNERYDVYWSCVSSKKVQIGDRFCLMRLGKTPSKGIVGCGYVSSRAYKMPHWDPVKAAQRKTAPRTDLWFKTLSKEPLITLSYLEGRYPTYNWTPEGSGVPMPDLIAVDVFAIIQGKDEFSFTENNEKQVRTYSEGKPKKITTWTYDRSTEARNACVDHYGPKCDVCKFEFSSRYGGWGENYIEVHHLKPIADIKKEYTINPIRDLRPVCSNCHKMLHRRRPPISVQELKARLI